MTLDVLPLPVLIFSLGGATISFIVSMWTVWYFLNPIIQGMRERRKEMRRYDHDCALITAYNPKYSEYENSQRNKQLHAKIQINKYAVVTISNSGYDKFFVMDVKDRSQLGYDITKWSREYEQDTINFVPKNNLDMDKFFSYNDYVELKSKENELYNYYEVANISGKMSMVYIAKSDWREINV